MAAYERVTLNRGGRNSRFDCTLKLHFWHNIIRNLALCMQLCYRHLYVTLLNSYVNY